MARERQRVEAAFLLVVPHAAVVLPRAVLRCSTGNDPPVPRGVGTRTLGVDFGLRRTGVALSSGFSPLPLGVLVGNASETDFPRLAQLLVRTARTEDARQIVLGLPPEMDVRNLVLLFCRELLANCLRPRELVHCL